jgi:hypothetical protein
MGVVGWCTERDDTANGRCYPARLVEIEALVVSRHLSDWRVGPLTKPPRSLEPRGSFELCPLWVPTAKKCDVYRE